MAGGRGGSGSRQSCGSRELSCALPSAELGGLRHVERDGRHDKIKVGGR